MKKAAISWSSGKDSAFALHHAQQLRDLDVVVALTSVNAVAERVSMHGVRREVLDAQLDAVGLDVIAVELPFPCTNADYEAAMENALVKLKAREIEVMIFGDLFLEDVRDYRIKQLEGTGIEPIFPLWKKPTPALAQDMLDAGVETYIATLDPKKLDPALCGARWDADFIKSLPEGIDPCGENGEFHTVVANAPCFRHALKLKRGETVTRDGFVYTDFEIGE